MKALLVFVAIVALVAADCDPTYKPPKRGCGWGFSVLKKNDTSAYFLKDYYFVNGKFWSIKEIDYGGNVLSYNVFRPDIPYSDSDKSSYWTSDKGQCKKNPSVVSVTDNAILKYILADADIEFTSCSDSDVEFNGKKCKNCKKYSRVKLPLGVGSLDINAYVDKNNKVIGVDGFGLQLAEEFKTDKYIIDWYSSAPMTKFAYNRLHAYKCPDQRIYDSGDDDYTLCAGTTTKAALAVVVSALATALLVLF